MATAALADGTPKKIVMVLYKAGDELAKSNPKLLGALRCSFNKETISCYGNHVLLKPLS